MSFQSFLSKTLHFLRSLLVSSYLAGNHGKTNRGSLKITNLKQYKNHSVFEITQNDHSLPFFHPSRYGGHIAGYFFSVTGRAPQLDALPLPLQQLPQPKLPHAKPAAAVAARSVPQQKTANPMESPFSSSLAGWPYGKLRKPRIVITRRGSKMVQALHHALLHGPHRANLKAFDKESLKFPVIIGTI